MKMQAAAAQWVMHRTKRHASRTLSPAVFVIRKPCDLHFKDALHWLTAIRLFTKTTSVKNYCHWN